MNIFILCMCYSLVSGIRGNADDLQSLKDDLLHLKNKMDILEANVSALESSNQQLRIRNGDLEATLQQTKKQFLDANNAVKNDMQYLYQSLQHNQIVFERNIQTIESFRNLINSTENETNVFEQRIEDMLSSKMSALMVNDSYLEAMVKESERNFIEKLKVLQNDLQYLHHSHEVSTNITQQNIKYLEGLVSFTGNLVNKTEENRKIIRGFTVVNSGDITDHVNGPVKFDTVVTNYGGRYNVASGVFTADIPGLYVFFSDIRVMKDGHTCYLALTKNGHSLCETYGNSEPHYLFKPESCLAFTEMNIGDEVWVRSYTVSGHTCEIDDHSTFSGFLQQHQ